MQKYGFAISPSDFAVSTHGKFVGQGGQLACLVTSFDVMQFALQMTEVQSTNHKIILICMNLGLMYF